MADRKPLVMASGQPQPIQQLQSGDTLEGVVYGPSSATDNAVARFDGTTGKLVQNSVVIVGDTGIVTGITEINGGIVFNQPAADVDFRVKSDTSNNAFIVDAGLHAIQIGTAAAGDIADFRTAAIVFNESGGDQDFRVEGDTATQLLVCDASTDSVNIGTTTIGQIAAFTPAIVTINDGGVDIDFRVEGDSATNLLVCDASADAVQIGTTIAGSIATFDNSGIVFNETAVDRDFRVEGDTLTHLLFIDGSAATENIAMLAGAAPNWQSMDGGLFIADATTAPTGNPTGGVFLWATADELNIRNSAGDIVNLFDGGGSGTDGVDGGALTIRYTFDDATTSGDPGNGILRFDNATQFASITARLDDLDALGENWETALLTLDDATNTIKAWMRVVNVADPTKWILFGVTAVTDQSGYVELTIGAQDQSDSSPFVDGDTVAVAFTQSANAGQGVPAGGTTGQILAKDSNADYDTEWIDAPAGGGTTIIGVQNFRLGVVAGDPGANATGVSTLYASPVNGNQIALYDGSAWAIHDSAEFSLSLSGLTAGNVYDVFIYDNAGTLTMELSTAWTNTNTRATALAKQDGVFVKSGDATRRYVGTIRAVSATTITSDTALRYVYNYYNRFRLTVSFAPGSATVYTYSTATHRITAGTDEAIRMVVGVANEHTLDIVASFFGTMTGATPNGQFTGGYEPDNTGGLFFNVAGRASVINNLVAPVFNYVAISHAGVLRIHNIEIAFGGTINGQFRGFEASIIM